MFVCMHAVLILALLVSTGEFTKRILCEIHLRLRTVTGLIQQYIASPIYSLVPRLSHARTPALSVLCKRRKAGRWPGNEATPSICSGVWFGSGQPPNTAGTYIGPHVINCFMQSFPFCSCILLEDLENSFQYTSHSSESFT